MYTPLNITAQRVYSMRNGLRLYTVEPAVVNRDDGEIMTQVSRLVGCQDEIHFTSPEQHSVPNATQPACYHSSFDSRSILFYDSDGSFVCDDTKIPALQLVEEEDA